MSEIKLQNMNYEEPKIGNVVVDVEEADEDTPLLQIPRVETPEPPLFYPAGATKAGVLCSMFIAGLIIGIYLLVLQQRAENIIPPDAEMAKYIVEFRRGGVQANTNLPKTLIIKTGVTKDCFQLEECLDVLNEVVGTPQQKKVIPFNVLISSDGKFLIVDDWNMATARSDAYIITVMGNFSNATMNGNQMVGLYNFVMHHESSGELGDDYVVISNNLANRKLVKSLKGLPHFCPSCILTRN